MSESWLADLADEQAAKSAKYSVQNDRGWRTLVTDVFGRPGLADDERFATNIERVRHRTEVDAAVADGPTSSDYACVSALKTKAT